MFLAFVEGPRGSGFAKLAVVKRLRPNLAEDPEFVSMLMDEGRVTARLSHPNIVQMFEVGRDGDDYFLAMEHLDGQPLHLVERRIAKASKDVPQELFYAIIIDVLAALHYAHDLADYDGTQLGIVHRDVTPHNIFVTYEGTVKVVDFGIAKAVGRLTETRQGIVKGKVRYMSPEQAGGREVDRRTDIFAAGVLLYKACSGQKFWATRDEFEIPRALVSGEYDPSPRAVNPAVPEDIDAICRKALAFNPDDRYETAAQMQADLEKAVAARALARRDIAAVMQELFEPERQNVRSLVETAAGELTASMSELGIEAEAADVDRTDLMTVVMARTRPARPPPSVAPIAVTVDPPSPPSTLLRRRTTHVSDAGRGLERKLPLAVLAGLAIGTLAALVASAGRNATKPSSAVVSAARTPRAPALEYVDLSHDAMAAPIPVTSASVEPSAPAAPDPRRAKKPAAPSAHTRSTPATLPRLAPAGSLQAPAAERPAEPAPETPRATTQTKHSSPDIDKTDPWSGGSNR